MKTIAIVACVKEKQDTSATALELYQGDDFESWVWDAQSRNAAEIYILSGKYGLLRKEDIIEPYDLNLGEQSKSYQLEWNIRVLNRLQSLEDLKNVHVLIYTNKTYYKNLLSEFDSYEIPFKIR